MTTVYRVVRYVTNECMRSAIPDPIWLSEQKMRRELAEASGLDELDRRIRIFWRRIEDDDEIPGSEENPMWLGSASVET